jgi:hypothetical protein
VILYSLRQRRKSGRVRTRITPRALTGLDPLNILMSFAIDRFGRFGKPERPLGAALMV